MARKRLLDQDAQRERRRQLIIIDRLAYQTERLLSAEVAKTTRDMVKTWLATGSVPAQNEHERRVQAILTRTWERSIGEGASRIEQAARDDRTPKSRKSAERWQLFLSEYMQAFGAEKIQQITDTTRSLILRQIGVGAALGESQSETGKRIMDAVPLISRQRANLIARTETHSATNYGSLEQAKSAGMEMQKEWIAANQPGRTRDAHLDADGQIVGLNDPFIVDGESLMYPGDPSGSAHNVINCRCAQSYIVL